MKTKEEIKKRKHEYYDKYRGCKIEHSCAVEYGIKVIEYVEG